MKDRFQVSPPRRVQRLQSQWCAHFAAAAAPASTFAGAASRRWSAPTASATLANPSRSSRAASSRFTRGTSLGPS